MRNVFLELTKSAHLGALALALILSACGKDDGGGDAPRDPSGDSKADGGAGRDAGKDGGKADAGTKPSDDDDDGDEVEPSDDDDISDDRDTTTSDASTGGPRDASVTDVGGGDAGTQGSVSSTLADALKVEGVDGSDERAGLLFPAACKARQSCAGGDTCEHDVQGLWQDVTKAGLDAGCRDAALDVFACAVTKKSCEPAPECQALIASRGDCLASLAPH